MGTPFHARRTLFGSNSDVASLSRYSPVRTETWQFGQVNYALTPYYSPIEPNPIDLYQYIFYLYILKYHLSITYRSEISRC